MKTISVYDDTAKRIEKISDEYDVSEAEVIAVILENLSDEELDEMLY